MLAELAIGLVLASSAGERTVPCAEVIQTVAFPYVGSARYPSQLVLDAASAPGKHVPQSSETGKQPWTWFSKWGMVVRGGEGEPVIVTVPRTWRNRVAVVWGNGGHRVFHTIRFPRCGDDTVAGNAYSGGFFLRKPSGCVPLRFTVGERTTLVWFGIVRRCARR